jgi:hypothetical protein
MTQGNVTLQHFDGDDMKELIWNAELYDSNEKVLLEPGKTIDFLWCDSHTVEEWIDAQKNPLDPFNENSSCKIQFRAWDCYQNAFDYIDLEVQGYPLQPVQKSGEKWVLEPAKLASTIYPVQRLYGEKDRENYKSPYAYRNPTDKN